MLRKKYGGKMLVYVLLQFIKYGLLLLPPYCYLLFLEEIITARRFEKIWLILGLYILVFLGKSLVSVLIQNMYHRIFPAVTAELKEQLLRKYSSLDIQVLQEYTAGELKERLHKDTENTVIYWEKKLEFMISLVSAVITVIILLSLNLLLAIISFLLLPVSFLVTRYIKSRSNVEYERQRQIQSVHNDFMIHNMFFWKEVKSNCQEMVQEERFNELWKDMGKAFLNAHMCWFLNRTFLAFKDVFITKMALYLLGGILVIHKMSTVSVLLAFVEYYADFANRLLEMADNVMKRGEQEQSVKRVEEILRLELSERPYRLSSFEKLECKDICFSYSEEQGPILQDFCMELYKADSVAIRGESGCGKSTLIKLLAGYLKPEKGTLFWNGQNMDLVDRESLYEKVGFLMQESVLFNLTIRENLLFGKENATEEEIIDACRRANILDFIQELSQGFETVIGENGIRLSGGQKQRLVIARLFLRNPEVIVFDEATSALDYQNEREILELLLQNAEEKTFLMVTHRGTSVERCDKVIRLGNNCASIN
uniref:ABC transporter ATP-binding protein n=1 Tax=Acetatifactor sp. TaxID=1872090 RepID=UPI0040579220